MSILTYYVKKLALKQFWKTEGGKANVTNSLHSGCYWWYLNFTVLVYIIACHAPSWRCITSVNGLFVQIIYQSGPNCNIVRKVLNCINLHKFVPYHQTGKPKSQNNKVYNLVISKHTNLSKIYQMVSNCTELDTVLKCTELNQMVYDCTKLY